MRLVPIAVAALVLTACGSDGGAEPATAGSTTSAPSTTTTSSPSVEAWIGDVMAACRRLDAALPRTSPAGQAPERSASQLQEAAAAYGAFGEAVFDAGIPADRPSVAEVLHPAVDAAVAAAERASDALAPPPGGAVAPAQEQLASLADVARTRQALLEALEATGLGACAELHRDRTP